MSHDAHRVVIGSGCSSLSQAEARWVGAELRRTHPNLKVDYVSVASESPRAPWRRALDEALLSGAVDVAVQSVKELSLDDEPGIVLAAVPTRELPFDVLVAPEGVGLEDLPRGARVGTAGVHRRAQLLSSRADVIVIDVAGDPHACLARFERGEIDALVLPGAELERLGLADRVSEILMASVCLPGPGQGAIAVRAREKDAKARECVQSLEDPVARAAVLAERACLRAVGGGADAPVAAYCEATGEDLALEALIASPDGRRIVRDSEEGPLDEAEAIGEALGRRLRTEGGDSILRAMGSAARG
jgi:hydroxymethylbilane synthase